MSGYHIHGKLRKEANMYRRPYRKASCLPLHGEVRSLHLERVVDLDDSWASQGTLRHGVPIGKCVRSGQSTVAEAVHNVLLVGEGGLEADGAAIPLDIGRLDREWELLASRVGEVQAVAVATNVLLSLVGAGEVSLEGELLILGLKECHGPAVGLDGRQDREGNVAQWEWARVRNHKHLKSRKGEGRGDVG